MTGTRYSYLGPEGTFSEEALRTLPDAADGALLPARTVPEALDAVRTNDADAALVPLENSVGGAVPVTIDDLAAGSPLQIVREVVLPIRFVFAARPGTAPADVRSVAAHPQASAQCREWLRRTVPDATVVDVLSNATAAVRTAAGEYDAALSTPLAARRNGLELLAEGVADHPDAMTRFAVVTRPAPPPPPTGNDVTTLAVYIRHDQVGALLAVLTELAVRGINMTRIESRPTGERLGRYCFFLDCTGHVADERMGAALAGLHRICADVKFFGSYPRAGGEPPVPPPAGMADRDFADATAWLDRIRAGKPD
ncbi:prephenate dehydratase [Actinocatenispora rupis]|uniref:Prephenate dehydratase n=1 Tax=Actinocatenispora rupis TaxID=519421 RepID=A0A8J3JE24_9ACTN|nr:prephenate dehydratase [Actinocatenispora rupis]GID13113.1 prephenate dehydratase [Actinocatenispora rupis]